ncbi:MAG: glycosidase [Calditrichia bacterium]
MSRYQLQRVNEVILGPLEAHPWESRAAFNPGAVRVDDDIHLLYRAVEGDNFSTAGYARLNRQGKVLYRHPEPVLRRTLPQESKGCEDLRIVPFENRYQIFYTAYNGSRVRIANAETDDFMSYRKFGLVGPDYTDKDAMIFPQHIGGKIAFLHRIEPNIQLALFENMDHFRHPGPDYWPDHLKNLEKHTVMYRQFDWESEKIGAGPPPILTDRGWLLIYHGVDRNITYRAGAALLEEKNPQKVIARLPYAILEPKRDYEKIGDVNNVVFPQGIALFDDELQIYYGGADKVVGLAHGSLKELLDALWQHRSE